MEDSAGGTSLRVVRLAHIEDRAGPVMRLYPGLDLLGDQTAVVERLEHLVW
jgi:hypothetical protein